MQPSTLTMREVAHLARVQRAVVSMWRKRPQVHGRFVPFPDPVSTTDGIERFSRDEIVAWLADTGRGNNPEAVLDANAVSVPTGVTVEDVVVLLALYARAGGEFAEMSAAELIGMAESVDRRNEFILDEVRALIPDRALLRYTDDLIETSFGPDDAYQRLTSGRLGWESGPRGLTTALIDLARALAATAAQTLGHDSRIAVLGEAALAWQIWQGLERVACAGESVRAQRRRAIIGEFDSGPGTDAEVRVLSVVGAAESAALDTVGEADLSLGPRDVAIVVGAASLLCDRLVGDLEHDRSYILRPGKLALAVRLPRGLWKAAHRQALGLWVLQGGRSAATLKVADLSGETLDRDDLSADLVAALTGSDQRAFRYARTTDLAPVLAGAAVVPRGVRAVLWGRADISHLDAVYSASLITAEPIGGFDVLATASPGHIKLTRRSLRQLCDAELLQVRRGNRIDRAKSVPAGTVRVLSADASAGDVRLDPLDAERLYPRATRTEPGDVIFSQSPRPAATVDTDGGSLVLSPSRIARILPGLAIGPHTLAALINDLGDAANEWETWTVPDFTPGEAATLETTLASAGAYVERLRGHLSAAQDLTRHLIQGVAAGAVTIHTTTTRTTTKAG